MTHISTLWVPLILSSLLAAASCGGAESAPAPAASQRTAGGEPPPRTPPPAESPEQRPAWEAMSTEQRAQYMTDTVVPTLEPLFQGFDAERFAGFGCPACHGENAREVAFQMPNGLAPLDPTRISAIFESDEPMAVFMTGTVWPKMAELLGRPRFDPETGEGFSCLNCHATKVR